MAPSKLVYQSAWERGEGEGKRDKKSEDKLRRRKEVETKARMNAEKVKKRAERKC